MPFLSALDSPAAESGSYSRHPELPEKSHPMTESGSSPYKVPAIAMNRRQFCGGALALGVGAGAGALLPASSAVAEDAGCERPAA